MASFARQLRGKVSMTPRAFRDFTARRRARHGLGAPAIEYGTGGIGRSVRQYLGDDEPTCEKNGVPGVVVRNINGSYSCDVTLANASGSIGGKIADVFNSVVATVTPPHPTPANPTIVKRAFFTPTTAVATLAIGAAGAYYFFKKKR